MYTIMISKELMAASTRPLILTILKRGKSYGYQIIQDVKQLSGGTLEWSDGMLYPVLHKLQKDGCIQSNWVMSEEGRRRKYYSITEVGLEELQTAKEQWLSIHEVFAKIWGPTPQWAT
ncbi:MAG: helix-turn-helix transcriptional regulator [Balneolaceae bacterium]